MSPTNDLSQDKLVLRYWNCAGRGMLMRYMAYDAGLDFIDDIVDIEEDFLSGTWENKKKFIPELAGPFKALPVVQHHGATINETGACAQYVAEIAVYMPTHPLDRAKVVLICDHIYEDILINVAYAIWGFRDWELVIKYKDAVVKNISKGFDIFTKIKNDCQNDYLFVHYKGWYTINTHFSCFYFFIC